MFQILAPRLNLSNNTGLKLIFDFYSNKINQDLRKHMITGQITSANPPANRVKHLFPAKVNGASSNGNSFTHFSQYAVVLRGNEKGKISVTAIDTDKTSECFGIDVHPGVIYWAKQMAVKPKGQKAKKPVIENTEDDKETSPKPKQKIALIRVATDGNLFQVGHYNDGSDDDARKQISEVVQKHSGILAEAANDLNIKLAESFTNPKATTQDKLTEQAKDKKTLFTIGENAKIRAEKTAETKANFRDYVTKKDFGNDKCEDGTRDRVRDRHLYAKAMSDSYLDFLGFDASTPVSEKVLEKNERRLKYINDRLTKTRRSDPRQIPKKQIVLFGKNHEWIPHEVIKSDTRRRSGKKTEGKEGTPRRLQSNTTTLTKAKATQIRRREDKRLSRTGLEELANDRSTEATATQTSLAKVIIAMHLEQPFDYDYRVTEHSNLVDAALASMNAIPFHIRTKSVIVGKENGNNIWKTTKSRDSRYLSIIAKEVEAFIEKYPDPKITDLAAFGLKSGIGLSMIGSLLETGTIRTESDTDDLPKASASTEQLYTLFKHHSPRMNTDIVNSILSKDPNPEFLETYLTFVKNVKSAWFDFYTFNQDTKTILEKGLGADFYKEYTELARLTDKVHYPRELFEADLNRLMELPYTAITVYRMAYEDFAKIEGQKRKDSAGRDPARENKNFKGSKTINYLVKALSTGEIYTAGTDLSSQNRATQKLNIPATFTRDHQPTVPPEVTPDFQI